MSFKLYNDNAFSNVSAGNIDTTNINTQTINGNGISGSSVYSSGFDAVVSLYNSTLTNKFGVGFLISFNGIFVTTCNMVCLPTGTDLILSSIPANSATFPFPFPNFQATVYNYNGTGQTVIEQCRLIGVDLRNNIAVMETVTELTNQNFFDWGNSQSTPIGNECYMIGNSLKNNALISSGVISDNIYSSTFDGYLFPIETICTSIVDFSSDIGNPILNANGQIIGMKASSLTTSGFVIGPSQYLLEPIVNRILDINQNNIANAHVNFQNKPYLGIRAHYFTSLDLSTLPFPPPIPLSFGITGVVIDTIGTGAPGTFNTSGTIVSGGLIANGDIILSINGINIGLSNSTQTTPSTPIWLTYNSGTSIIIKFITPAAYPLIKYATLSVVTFATAFGTGERFSTDVTRQYF